MAANRNIKHRIANIEKKVPDLDSNDELELLMDARVDRTGDIQDDIKWYKRNEPYSSLSAKQLEAFVYGEPVTTKNVNTKRPLTLILLNPKVRRKKD